MPSTTAGFEGMGHPQRRPRQAQHTSREWAELASGLVSQRWGHAGTHLPSLLQPQESHSDPGGVWRDGPALSGPNL